MSKGGSKNGEAQTWQTRKTGSKTKSLELLIEEDQYADRSARQAEGPCSGDLQMWMCLWTWIVWCVCCTSYLLLLPAQEEKGHDGWLCLCLVWVLNVCAAGGSAFSVAFSVAFLCGWLCQCPCVCICETSTSLSWNRDPQVHRAGLQWPGRKNYHALELLKLVAIDEIP